MDSIDESGNQLCELFTYSEKKLSHIYPETSEFRRVVQSDREWFENVHDLERTTFLAIDDENEKVMNFYAERIDEWQEILEDGNFQKSRGVYTKQCENTCIWVSGSSPRLGTKYIERFYHPP